MKELSQEELDELKKCGVSVTELADQWALFPDQDFITVVGAVLALQKGQGQERNEPLQTQAQADEQVSEAGKSESGEATT